METSTKAPLTMREARVRGDEFRKEFDAFLTEVLRGKISDVPGVEVGLKEVEANHEGVTFQKLVELAVPRIRVMWVTRPNLRWYYPAQLDRIDDEVREYLGLDRLVGA
jgi:hypothetical protein